MLKKKIRQQIKEEIRILGIDDAPFSRNDKSCLVVATVFRAGKWMDGLLSCCVKLDGDDSTRKIIQLIRKRHYNQLNCVMINGICLGGFNVVDIVKINKKTSLPVIAVIRKMPNFEKIKRALKIIKQEPKIKIMKKAGKIYRIKIKNKNIFFQCAGIQARKAAEIIKLSATHSLIPEPLRIAHIIASGIIKGESKGRV